MSNSHTGNSYVKDGLQRVKIWDGTNVVSVDNVNNCGALVEISYSHHKIHEGESYHLVYSVANIGTMTTPNDAIQIHFTTPTSKYMHMIFSGYCGAEALFKVTEAPTGGLSSPTGIITSYNRNRNSTNTTNISGFHYDATLATGGNLLKNEYIGSGSGIFAESGHQRGTSEWILKLDTIYAVSLTCTDNVPATLELDWYELG